MGLMAPSAAADGAGETLLHQLLASHEFGIAAEQNVGTAAGHVGGDGDHAEASGLGDDLRLALVVLGVQDDVPDAFALQKLREQLGFLDRRGAHQHGLLLLVQARDFVGDGVYFSFVGAVDHVRVLDAEHAAVGGNHHDFELVDLVELGRFGFRRSGHAGELFVQAEVILEGDGGERLIFALMLTPSLASTAWCRPSDQRRPGIRRPVNSSTMMTSPSFTTYSHVALVERVRLDGDLDVVLQIPVLRIGDVADAEQLLDLFPALVGDGDGAVLLVDDVVAGGDTSSSPGSSSISSPSSS